MHETFPQITVEAPESSYLDAGGVTKMLCFVSNFTALPFTIRITIAYWLFVFAAVTLLLLVGLFTNLTMITCGSNIIVVIIIIK